MSYELRETAFDLKTTSQVFTSSRPCTCFCFRNQGAPDPSAKFKRVRSDRDAPGTKYNLTQRGARTGDSGEKKLVQGEPERNIITSNTTNLVHRNQGRSRPVNVIGWRPKLFSRLATTRDVDPRKTIRIRQYYLREQSLFIGRFERAPYRPGTRSLAFLFLIFQSAKSEVRAARVREEIA